MKTRIIVCEPAAVAANLILCGLLLSATTLCASVLKPHDDKSKNLESAVPMKLTSSIRQHQPDRAVQLSPLPPAGYALDSITRLLRLKLSLDPFDYDDIAIAFNAGASPAYNFNEDARYLPGIGAAEGLASYSSDGIALSTNFLPLPARGIETIRLDVEAQNSGTFTLERTELDPLPPGCSLWLVDRYKKDSINLQTDTSYVVTVDKADTATFGSYRFSVVVSNSTPVFQLTGFNAVKQTADAQLSWTTQNEASSTHFYVERSTDRGATFKTIDSIMSCSAGAYTWADRNPPVATDEYRVKSTDMSGAVIYSNTITLLFSNNLNTVTGGITVFPNPTADMLQISIAGDAADTSNEMSFSPYTGMPPPLASGPMLAKTPQYNIKIMSMTGSVVRNVVSSSGSWEDSIGSLRPGAYVVQVVNTTTRSMVGEQTFIKM